MTGTNNSISNRLAPLPGGSLLFFGSMPGLYRGRNSSSVLAETPLQYQNPPPRTPLAETIIQYWQKLFFCTRILIPTDRYLRPTIPFPTLLFRAVRPLYFGPPQAFLPFHPGAETHIEYWQKLFFSTRNLLPTPLHLRPARPLPTLLFQIPTGSFVHSYVEHNHRRNVRFHVLHPLSYLTLQCIAHSFTGSQNVRPRRPLSTKNVRERSFWP